MSETNRIEWDTDRSVHLATHLVTTDQANEAVNDPDAVWEFPDSHSTTGAARVIGYSISRHCVITVILLPKDLTRNWGDDLPDHWDGITGWPASPNQAHAYLNQGE